MPATPPIQRPAWKALAERRKMAERLQVEGRGLFAESCGAIGSDASGARRDALPTA